MNIGTACCHSASCSDTACPGRPDPLSACAASGQCDSRQIAAHIRAGELDGIGYEGADAPRVTGAVPPIVTTELREVREPWDAGEIALVVAVMWLCGSIVYLRFWG